MAKKAKVAARKPAKKKAAMPATKSAKKRPAKKKGMMFKLGEAVGRATVKTKAALKRSSARRAKRQANILHLVGAEETAKKADVRAARRKREADAATKAAARV